MALVALGLAETREKAQALVMAGQVRVDERKAAKPGMPVREDARIELASGPVHVGRGALKLVGALEAFGLDPRGRIAVDVGASTGGFTQTLLEGGAAHVYAVDVGRAQLHERLRADPRVTVLERTNARTLSSREIHEACALATLDVSFISVLKILPALREVLAPEAAVVVLVKPQFEVGRSQVGRGGVVRDPALHRAALESVARGAEALGYAVREACPSPIAGARGNREFFLHLRRDGAPLAAPAFDAMMTRALS